MSQTDKPAPVANKFVGAGAFRVVDLQYPVEFDGKVYEKITVRRMTVAEVREFIREAAENPDVTMQTMIDVPAGVLEALDYDDFEKVDGTIYDFLPRLLREAYDQSRKAGESTPSSSQTSADSASES